MKFLSKRKRPKALAFSKKTRSPNLRSLLYYTQKDRKSQHLIKKS